MCVVFIDWVVDTFSLINFTNALNLQILEEIGCVEMKRLQKPAQCTLFSSRRRGLARGGKHRILMHVVISCDSEYQKEC